MKLLMISDYFPPEIGSASFLFYELGKELVKKGDKVAVVTGFPRYNIDREKREKKYKGKFIHREIVGGINVYRIRTFSLPRKINILRGIDQFLTAFLYFWRALFIDFDCVLIYSPPLTLGLTGFFLRILKRKKTVLNIQDLFPQSVIDLGALKNKYLIKFFERLEKFVYLKNTYITVHSKGNEEHVLKVCQGGGRVAIIQNWVNTVEISPGPKDNPFSRQYNLIDKFVVSFAGVLGESQDLDIILDSAKLLHDYKKIIFIIVGDGRKKQEIEIRKKEENIDNLLIIPMQPKDKYPLVLHSSDVGLVTLRSEVKSPVVPSKTLSIMAAGLPIIASMRLDGDTPEIIAKSKAGYCFEAGDTRGFTEGVLKIYQDNELRKELGQSARRFIEDNYSLNICSNMYRKIFNKLMKN